jgi:hypothetical protein
MLSSSFSLEIGDDIASVLPVDKLFDRLVLGFPPDVLDDIEAYAQFTGCAEHEQPVSCFGPPRGVSSIL